MMRTWRLRRAARAEEGALKKATSQKQRRVYKPDELRAVTFVVDADDDLGLVWGNRGDAVVLVKTLGIAKLHPHVETGMHLISINNQAVDEAIQAREICEIAALGEALTFLLWKPPTSSSPATSKNSISFKKKQPVAAEGNKTVKYITARVYKEHQDSKTGLTLKTENRVVRIARLSAPAPAHLHVGMRLVGIENSNWFSHHTEAVALIRSLPSGYVTFLLAEESQKRSNSLDNTSVATTAPGSWTTPEDDVSLMLDSSRRGMAAERVDSDATPETASAETQEDKISEQAPEAPAEPAPPKLLSATLTPEQAQQVILIEDEDDIVYLHAPVAHLSAGSQVVSVNGESLASAGHYEHFLQMAEEPVTLTVQASAEEAAKAASIVTATAVRPTFETKTGIILTNGKQGKVFVSRITPDSLFPTLQSGMQVLSINGHDWFTNYQEAIGLIRSLVGEITVVAQAVPEEVV